MMCEICCGWLMKMRIGCAYVYPSGYIRCMVWMKIFSWRSCENSGNNVWRVVAFVASSVWGVMKTPRKCEEYENSAIGVYSALGYERIGWCCVRKVVKCKWVDNDMACWNWLIVISSVLYLLNRLCFDLNNGSRMLFMESMWDNDSNMTKIILTWLWCH